MLPGNSKKILFQNNRLKGIKQTVCATFPSASKQSLQRVPARINRRLSDAEIENARERWRYRGAGSLSSDRRKLISRATVIVSSVSARGLALPPPRVGGWLAETADATESQLVAKAARCLGARCPSVITEIWFPHLTFVLIIIAK